MEEKIMKKILAIALAVVMIMSLAVFASAAETTLPDVTFGGWWSAHSQGVQITEEGFTMTFFADTEDGAAANYCTPSLVIHAGSADTLGTEYWVQRADAWGWLYGENIGDHAAALGDKGYSWSYTFEEGFTWENFQATTEAGTSAEVTAKLEGNVAVITYKIAGVINQVNVPVDAANPVFLCLTGERCTVSNIVVTTPDAPAEPVAVEDGKYVIACGDLTFAALAEDKGYGYPVAGSASALTDADYVTITNVADGQFTMQDCFGRYIYMKGSYNSFNVSAEMPTEGYLWVLEETEGGLMLKNVEKEKYLAYSEQYSSWGCYAEVTANFVLTVTAAEEPDINQPTGDAIFAVLAIFAASGMGLTAVVSKKR